MHSEFYLRLDEINSSSLPQFLTEEVDDILNSAILRFTKTRYSKNNLYRSGFEERQKRTEDLKALTVTATVASTEVVTEENTYSVSFPNDWLFYLRGRAEVNSPNCENYFTSIDVIQQDDIETVKGDPFAKPDKFNVVGYFENNSLYLLSDGTFSIPNAKLTYLSYPDTVVHPDTGNPQVDCNLSEHTHDEIVELAVKLALNQIESPREQTQQGILNKIE